MANNEELEYDKELIGKEPWRKWKCPKELKELMDRWQKEAYERLAAYRQMWYAKYVYIEFKYKDKDYRIFAGDMNIPTELLEILENKIADDLKELGCTDVMAYGMID